jgi:T5orf172 domain
MNDDPTDAEQFADGSAVPTGEVRSELRVLLAADESRLGQVYRLLEQGLGADAVAEQLGVGTSSFVWNYGRTIRALLDNDLPVAPTVALAAARTFRSFLRTASLSAPTRTYLQDTVNELERRANDVERREEETQRAKEQTQEAESRNEAGIYVYALPHYLRYPFDPDSGRTLLKVGRSDSDIIVRFRTQTRTTALPEEPILLRIYRVTGMATSPVESSFHRLLEAADHNRSVARSAGREWFLTSTRFLDEIARILGLDVQIINDSEIVEEA